MVLQKQSAQQTHSQEVETDESEYDDVWPTRMPNSTLRYQQPLEPDAGDDRNLNRRLTAVPPRRTAIPPGSYVQGNTRFNVLNSAPPAPGKKQKHTPRPNVNTANPPGVIYGHPYKDTEEPQTRPKRRLHLLRGWRIHPLLYLGVGMLVMLALWVGLTSLISFVQLKMNDVSYGYPRTYQIDGVINQNGDSQANPTHIIFLNNNRKIEVIVIPP